MNLDYVGWQLGITYQAPGPQGIDWPYLKDVIDRSADAGMNLLSLMMLSYAYHDPEHDGYAWPVTNPLLEPLKDRACLNADPRHEFVRRALDYAKGKGFHCQLAMNAMIWNPERVRQSYPDAEPQQLADGSTAAGGWLHCPDSPGAFRLALDEVTDLLSFYADYPVDSFAFERMGYNAGTCFCAHSRDRFRQQTGLEMDTSRLSHLIWKGNSVRELLSRYVERIRQTRPGIQVWAHTGGEPEWGHFPHVLAGAGIDIVANHGQHFLPTSEAFHEQVDWLSPLPCVPHICVRDLPTHNYAVPPRTPESIAENATWLERYPGERMAGAMFFNEVHTSERNKAAVYDVVRRWQTRA